MSTAESLLSLRATGRRVCAGKSLIPVYKMYQLSQIIFRCRNIKIRTWLAIKLQYAVNVERFTELDFCGFKPKEVGKNFCVTLHLEYF